MYNYIACKTLETDRLIIRVVIEKDYDSFFAFCSDEEVTKYLTFKPYKSKLETKKVIQNMIGAYIAGSDINYSIILKENNALIGSVSLEFFKDNDDVELGYIFNRNYWNNGYAYESISTILENLHTSFKRNKVKASCIKDNIRSSKLLEKLGFNFIKEENKYLKDKGEYAILNYEKTWE